MNNTNNRRKFPTNLLFWALLFIGMALILLLDAVGVADTLLPAGLSIWRVLLGAVIAWMLILGIIKLQPFPICFGIAAEVILFDEYVLRTLGSDKKAIAPFLVLMLVALLFSIGFQILKHAVKGSRPPVFTRTGSQAHRVNHTTVKAAGTSTQYFDCAAPFHGSVENNLGTTLVFFTNTEHYVGESTLHIDNNLGAVVLHAPADFLITSHIDNNLGSIIIPPSAAANPQKRLVLRGDNNMGSVVVKYQPVASPADDTVPQPQPQRDTTSAQEVVEPEILPKADDDDFKVDIEMPK